MNPESPIEPPLLGITLGDINGIGPEVLARALASPKWHSLCRIVVIGDLDAYTLVTRDISNAPKGYAIEALSDMCGENEDIPILNAGTAAPARRPGLLDAEAGRCAARWIECGAHLALNGALAGLVTAPVNKECMLAGGCPHAGHTPLLAALSGVSECHMSLFSPRMRIVHITAHLSMKDAVAAVTEARVLAAIHAASGALTRLGFEVPRIAIAGLNPHAGESGAFGDEEILAIRPAIEAAREEGLTCSGPYAPDTVFQRMYNGDFDVVVAMYHDQGHIPFKLVAMDEGVHVTLGLPFIRTSPDHGTAYDIAGTGAARADSMQAAIELTALWARQKPAGHSEQTHL